MSISLNSRLNTPLKSELNTNNTKIDSPQEQESELRLASSRLQDFFELRLLSSNSRDVADCILRIIKVVNYTDYSLVIDNFFINLFKVLRKEEDSRKSTLEKLLAIVEKRLGDSFFKCVSTNKTQYYEVDTLLKIIDAFHNILSFLPDSSPYFFEFPPYDEGGEKLLEQLLNSKNPEERKRLLKISDSSFSSLSKDLKDIFALKKSVSFDSLEETVIQYLETVNEEQRLTTQLYKKALEQLRTIKMFNEERQGIVFLLLLTTIRSKNTIQEVYAYEDIKALLDTTQKMHDVCGEEVLIQFCQAPDLQKGVSLKGVLTLLQGFCKGYQNQDQRATYEKLLKTFSSEEKSIEKLFKQFDDHSEQQSTVLSLDKIADEVTNEELLKRFSEEDNSRGVSFPLPKKICEKVYKQYEQVLKYCKEYRELSVEELVKKSSKFISKRDKDQLDDTDIAELLAIGRLALFATRKRYANSTQVWAVLALLAYKNRVITQIKTGEGKSTIVMTLLAFILTFSSPRQGHITSSAEAISINDQKKAEPFFKPFGIKTSSICGEDPEPSQFQSRILYGTAANFMFAIMKEMLRFQKLFPDEAQLSNGKRFKWMISDERDIVIDTTLNSTRFSEEAESTHQWIYKPLLLFIKENLNTFSDDNIDKQVSALRKQLKGYLDGRYSQAVDKMSNEILKKELRAANKALTFQNRIDYVVSGKQKDGNKILIIDVRGTGWPKPRSRWNGGVHEYVETNENLIPGRVSYVPISFSDSVLDDLYEIHKGMTGTAGSQEEREGVESFDVPTHVPSKRKDLGTHIFKTTKEKIEAILKRVSENRKQGRPTLLLCSSIKASEELAKRFEEDNINCELFTGIQSKPESEIIKLAGEPGAVLITTNVGGRGIDITPSKECLKQGGLSAILTFYPDLERAENQFKGRCARNREEGTTEMLLSLEELREQLVSSDISLESSEIDKESILAHLSKQRRKMEIARRNANYSYAQIERHRFVFDTEFYSKLKQFHELVKNKAFIEQLASSMAFRKLSQSDRHSNQLNSQDRQIEKITIELLTTQKKTLTQWTALLQLTGERIIKLATRALASFRDQAEELAQREGIEIDETLIKKRLALKELTRSQSKDFDQMLRESADTKIEAIKKELQIRYNEQRKNWENHLLLSGKGIIQYLSTITGEDLTTTLFETPYTNKLLIEGKQTVRKSLLLSDRREESDEKWSNEKEKEQKYHTSTEQEFKKRDSMLLSSQTAHKETVVLAKKSPDAPLGKRDLEGTADEGEPLEDTTMISNDTPANKRELAFIETTIIRSVDLSKKKKCQGSGLEIADDKGMVRGGLEKSSVLYLTLNSDKNNQSLEGLIKAALEDRRVEKKSSSERATPYKFSYNKEAYEVEEWSEVRTSRCVGKVLRLELHRLQVNENKNRATVLIPLNLKIDGQTYFLQEFLAHAETQSSSGYDIRYSLKGDDWIKYDAFTKTEITATTALEYAKSAYSFEYALLTLT